MSAPSNSYNFLATLFSVQGRGAPETSEQCRGWRQTLVVVVYVIGGLSAPYVLYADCADACGCVLERVEHVEYFILQGDGFQYVLYGIAAYG